MENKWKEKWYRMRKGLAAAAVFAAAPVLPTALLCGAAETTPSSACGAASAERSPAYDGASTEHSSSSACGKATATPSLPLSYGAASAVLPLPAGDASAFETFGLSDLFGEQPPERWFAGDCARRPTVRSQGSYGTCWALAAASALETALLPGEQIVFSADHLALKNHFEVPVDEGGDCLMTMAYLSGWQGPVTEEEDPYGDAFSPDGLTPAVHVQEIQLLSDADEDEIKLAVQKYGAVQASFYMNRAVTSDSGTYYNRMTAAYYCPDRRVQDHDIVILGWDDSVSRFLFREIPDRDGAWICQNSWGEEFGMDGLFYVSYADANICGQPVAYTRVEPADNYASIYQTDECGWQGTQGYGDEECWIANTYRAADRMERPDGETLAAVGFYATGRDTSYEIYFADGGMEEVSEIMYVQSGSLTFPGYYTVDFEEEIPLSSGQNFSVIVRVKTPGAEYPAAVEYRADEYTKNVVTENKFGYISRDGEEWEHTESAYGTNICLKAYTR